MNYSKLLISLCTRSYKLFLFLLLSMVSFCNAQDIVVNEYKNITLVPEGETTELLVVTDNVSLVGFTLRDNSAAGGWQAGIKFKDVPLWKNLRAGTVIWIAHRGTAATLDVSAADGSIRIGSESAGYFDKVLFTSSNWAQDALSIAQTSDIIQLLDAAGNNHHALGHGTPTYETTVFNLISGPKVFVYGSMGISNSVFPGATLADYNASGAANKAIITLFESPGYPNYNNVIPFGDIANSNFWRLLRQPIWNTPTVTGNVNIGATTLNWNAATDPNPTDNYQGYLIVRAPETVADTLPLPKDGVTYAKGDMIGGWKVVDNIIGSQNLTLTDNSPLNCGEPVKYRIYAFRYKADDIDSAATSTNSWFAKGRSYNETSFGRYRAIREVPTKPFITALNSTAICQGTSVILRGPTLSGFGFEWTKDGFPIPNARAQQYTATEGGVFRLIITSSNGCTSESDPITVTVLPKPIALISPQNEAKICNGDSVQLKCNTAGSSFTWLLEGNPIAGNTNSTLVKIAGNYRVIVTDDKGCKDTSVITTVKFRNVALQFPDPLIDFGSLDGCKSSETKTTLLRNTGLDTSIIDKVIVPPGFQYLSPALPIILIPGKSVTLTFGFAPIQPGAAAGKVIINSSPCLYSTTIDVKGFKQQSSVNLSYNNADFGKSFLCETKPQDTIITITNKGTSSLSITSCNVNAPFSIINPTVFPLIIDAGKTASITVRYAASAEGIFSGLLSIPYTAGSCKDTLKIGFNGEVIVPAYALDTNTIIIPDLLGCTASADTMITLKNTGKSPITINSLSIASGISILNPLPLTIPIGQSADINIRVSPGADGAYYGTIQFRSVECQIDKSIIINVIKKSAAYTLSTNKIVFKDLIRCSKTDPILDSIEITASALGIKGDAIIGSISRIGAPNTIYSISLNKDDTLTNGTKTFKVYFTPGNDGTFASTFSITFQPCSITQEFAVSGSLSTIDYSINTDTLEFPLTDSGMVEIKTFTFTNKSSLPITIASLQNVQNPFTFYSTTLFNQVIPKDSSVNIEFSYSPLGKQVDSTIAILTLGGPCPKTIPIVLKGTGNQVKPNLINGTAQLIGDDKSAAPGNQVIFPFRIQSDDIKNIKVKQLSFTISYNPTLLLPKSIVSKQNSVTIDWKEMVPGFITINAKGIDTTIDIQSGELCELECTALLGDSMQTRLRIAELSVEKGTLGTFSLTMNTPVFTLIDICDLPGRLMRIQGNLSLQLVSHGLAYEIVSQDKSTLEIYSTGGACLYTLHQGHLPAGMYTASLPAELPSGLYYAYLRSGRFSKILPFGFIR